MREYCNPLNLNYRFQHYKMMNELAHRESADPTLVRFKGRYYLFASMGGGFWHSSDLLEWEFKKEERLMYLYAPDVRQVGDYLCFTASTRSRPSSILRTKDPLNEPFEEVSAPFEFWDPGVFEDDDKRTYIYWGCSNKTPLCGIELEPETMLPIGEKKALLNSDVSACGWERTDFVRKKPKSLQEKMTAKIIGTKPFIEGSYVNKHNGKYYLQYAAPGTEYFSYGDGVAIADLPLGEFKKQAHNPFSLKPGGFIKGAGHGSTIQDEYGNWWHIASMVIAVNANFERRLGLFPCGFDRDGVLFCNQNFADYPLEIPKGRFDPLSVKPKWMLLSYKKSAAASSSCSAEHTPEHGVDENIKTCWCAKSAKPGEWYMLDLGKVYDVRSVQLNFADVGIPKLRPAKKAYHGEVFQQRYIDMSDELYTRYLLEASEDGESWKTVVDKQNAKTNLCNDYLEFEQGLRARYLRVTGKEFPYGSRMAISGLRVFGKAQGEPPAAVIAASSERTSELDALLSWDKAQGAVGYNVRWGTAPDKLYSSWLLYEENKLKLPFLNAGQEYYFAVDSFNEVGITAGKPQKL